MRYWVVRPPPECGWSGKKKQKGKGFAMNTSKKTQLALVYIRYSSHAQDNGNSPAAQMTCAENYTEAHQMTIEQIYHDYAKTGRNHQSGRLPANEE